jgi:ribosomal protein S18 acetylase RimI-like enzyme
MNDFRVLIGTDAELPDAQTLVFEYLASTQREAGRAVPASVDELPEILRAECVDLASAYRAPGALLLVYDDHHPIGCVGLKPTALVGTIEVKRLYVRPAHRRCGVGRLLMDQAHHHAASHGFTCLVLDVIPTRTQVIDFYRRLGYIDAQPYSAESTDPMIWLQRPVSEPVQP